MQTSKTLELTREETYALESVLKNDEEEEGVHIAKHLLLKIGSAFVQQNQDGPDLSGTLVTIALTEKETWLARDRIPITLQIGHQPVGLTLKKKLYRILLEFDTEAQAGEVIEDWATSVRRDDHAGKSKPRYHRKARHDAGAAKKASA
ncbi:MAG: hypothetical protein EXR60_07130 [Dehalococcoidia bacterium]|nr:hypothetical protein [Dehalococcoidia bacterium]